MPPLGSADKHGGGRNRVHLRHSRTYEQTGQMTRSRPPSGQSGSAEFGRKSVLRAPRRCERAGWPARSGPAPSSALSTSRRSTHMSVYRGSSHQYSQQISTTDDPDKLGAAQYWNLLDAIKIGRAHV